MQKKSLQYNSGRRIEGRENNSQNKVACPGSQQIEGVGGHIQEPADQCYVFCPGKKPDITSS